MSRSSASISAAAPRVRPPRGTAAAGCRAPPLLEVAAINTYYGKSHVLHDVSFAVREREVWRSSAATAPARPRR